jgi:hypothetical protein
MAAWALAAGRHAAARHPGNVDFYRSHEQALKKLAPRQVRLVRRQEDNLQNKNSRNSRMESQSRERIMLSRILCLTLLGASSNLTAVLADAAAAPNGVTVTRPAT